MFFFFSKVLTLFLFPLPLVIITGIALTLKFGTTKKHKAIMCLPFLILWFFSTNFTSQLLITPLEDSFESKNLEEIEYHDYAVVLGGMFNNLTRIPSRPELNSSADRITDTVALYKKKKIGKIVFTGGSGSLFFDSATEKDLAKIFFDQQGILEEDILWEGKSRNTRENALFTAELLVENSQVLLITSAFHMSRSVSEFEKVGIQVTPFPTDYRSLHEGTGLWENMVPLTGALDTSTIAIKEWIGRLAYSIF